MNYDFDIKKEKEFFQLFGLEVMETGFKNSYAVLDENKAIVGDIHKVLGTKERYIPNYFYSSSVATDKIDAHNVRSLSDEKFTYKINLVEYPDVTLYIELGKESKLVIVDKNKKVGSLCVTDKSINLDYHVVIPDVYDVNVSMLYQDRDEAYEGVRGNKSYAYKMSYVNLKGPIAGIKYGFQCGVMEVDKENVRFLTSVKGPENLLEVKENHLLKGSVEEAFIEHEGLNSLMYFRDVINNYYPFTEDVVALMLENSKVGKDLNVFRSQKKYTK